MRAFLGRIVGNAGSSLTAGGTVLAIGVALGAIGLAETTSANSAKLVYLRPPQSPFANGWVICGLIAGVIGALWVIGTFVLALIATAKTERFRQLLGHALNDGERLHEQAPPTTLQVIRAWGQQAHDLVQAGYGPGEARLFLGEWDLPTQHVTGKEPEGHLWLERRLMRLSRLMDRMHLMQVGPGTRLPAWTYVSSPPAP